MATSPRISQAMAEAYTGASPVKLLDVVSLSNPGWEGAIHLCRGIEEALNVVLETGQTVTLTPCAYNVTKPGYGEDGPEPAQMSIDNVSALLLLPFDVAVASGQPVMVEYRCYRSDDLSAPGDVITGMRLREPETTATSASGTLDFEQVTDQGFPRAIYTLDEFPGIWTTGSGS